MAVWQKKACRAIARQAVRLLVSRVLGGDKDFQIIRRHPDETFFRFANVIDWHFPSEDRAISQLPWKFHYLRHLLVIPSLVVDKIPSFQPPRPVFLQSRHYIPPLDDPTSIIEQIKN